VTEFLDWRQQKHPEFGCYRACKNTALHELSLLGLIMSEAIAREFASVNPCLRLGDRPDPARVKPRITEAEHQRILEALKTQPEWMRTSYMIAYEQGCRFSETSLPLSDVDLDSMVIGFRTKGRKEKVTFFPLSERLVPMFKEMKKKGYRETFVIPRTATMQWHRFFKRIGLGHLCFHCLRVTFVTRCEEAGLTAEECMRLVGHSSFLVHQRYRRMRADHPSVQAMRKLLA
jgi:integrase